MAAPTHYIRTIHSSFAAHSPSTWGSHNVLADLGGLINQYPPGLGFGPQEVAFRPVGRRRHALSSPLEFPASPKQTYIPSSPSRSPYTKFDPFADENAIETVRSVPRSSPSPSPSPSPAQYLSHNKKHPAPPLSLSSTKAHSSQVMPRSTAINAWPPSLSNRGTGSGSTVSVTTPHSHMLNNRNARAKLVAGILLNRVHAVGKPMRRRCFAGEPREYVKSRLSSVITAEA